MLRHERLADITKFPPTVAHIPADLTLGNDRPMLLNEALPDTTSGVTLLARRIPIRHEPRVDQRAIHPELRRRPRHRPPLDRRHRRRERLTDSPPVNTMTRRQRVDREALPIPIPPDLLEQLHA